jgi:hypothetical protein
MDQKWGDLHYLDEFTYGFNGREDEKLFQNSMWNLVNGKTLTFKKVTKTAQEYYAKTK